MYLTSRINSGIAELRVLLLAFRTQPGVRSIHWSRILWLSFLSFGFPETGKHSIFVVGETYEFAKMVHVF